MTDMSIFYVFSMIIIGIGIDIGIGIGIGVAPIPAPTPDFPGNGARTRIPAPPTALGAVLTAGF